VSINTTEFEGIEKLMFDVRAEVVNKSFKGQKISTVLGKADYKIILPLHEVPKEFTTEVKKPE
jgi:hypothetical protein